MASRWGRLLILLFLAVSVLGASIHIAETSFHSESAAMSSADSKSSIVVFDTHCPLDSQSSSSGGERCGCNHAYIAPSLGAATLWILKDDPFSRIHRSYLSPDLETPIKPPIALVFA